VGSHHKGNEGFLEQGKRKKAAIEGDRRTNEQSAAGNKLIRKSEKTPDK